MCVGKRKLTLVFLVFFGLFLSGTVIADFYAKVPEINPGDGLRGYDLYQPPWYPYDVEEATKYTVDESGKLVEREEGDQGLLNYGEKPQTKAEEIKYEIKKLSEKLIFEKVVASPRTIVWDFYGHIKFLSFDLPDMGYSTGFVIQAGNDLEFGGYPPIPGDNRTLYDGWVIGLISGWNYSLDGVSYGPAVWKGLVVPNLREFSLFMVDQGVATAKHALVLLERDTKRTRFNPGQAALKAMSGKDYGRDVGKWSGEYVMPMWNKRHQPVAERYDDWDLAVHSLVMKDISSKRVPARKAFLRSRDVPELSEPLFLDLIEKDKASLIVKRNLACVLEEFGAPRVAKALHKLARDDDTVTATRAVTSLSRHPHGKVKQILCDWLEPKQDGIRRAKAILMMGRTQSQELAQKLIDYLPHVKDDMEKELVFRSLMRMRHQGALALFKENQSHSFETLAYTSQLGCLVLGDLNEGQAMKIIDEAFYREDAIPMSRKMVSYANKFRFDLVKWMAETDMKKPRRRLWKYIREFKDLGQGSESGGVAHLLTYGLYQIKLGDDVIDEKEAVKSLVNLTNNNKDTQLQIAALTRLYPLNKKKCLDVCHKVIERFLKGRKIGETSGNVFDVTEKDFLLAAVNLVLIDDPNQEDLIKKIMTSKNYSGDIKSHLLEKLYNLKRKLALTVIRDNLKYYSKKSDLDSDDERYVVRLLRFAGMFKDPNILNDITAFIDKSSDPWLRFISLYSLRLALKSDAYANVISGDAQDKHQLSSRLRKEIKNMTK